MREFKNIETGEIKRFSTEIKSDASEKYANNFYGFIRHKKRIFNDANVFFLNEPKKNTHGKVLGKAIFKTKEIFVNLKSTSPESERVLFHELWHQVSKHKLTEWERLRVHTEFKCLGNSWGSDYFNDPEERAARAFEGYASARSHGLGFPPAQPGTALEIFEVVYEGRLDDLNHNRRPAQTSKITNPHFLIVATIIALVTIVIGLRLF